MNMHTSKTHFYSHLVEVNTITLELDKMDLSDDERMHLGSLIDANLHHTILDVILSELNITDKQLFMDHLEYLSCSYPGSPWPGALCDAAQIEAKRVHQVSDRDYSAGVVCVSAKLLLPAH
jgi:hypothetical protein